MMMHKMKHKMTREEFLIVVEELRARGWDTQDSMPPFHGADLRGADLWSADLSGADLSGADLSGADLSGADLTVADLTDADLTGAYLTGADLSGANLTGANLTDANLTVADLTDANLTDADLSGAIFDIPIGMSLRNDDVRKQHGADKWLLGCWNGNARHTVDRMLSEKRGLPLVSYLARMLSFAVDMTPEQRNIVRDALNKALESLEN